MSASPPTHCNHLRHNFFANCSGAHAPNKLRLDIVGLLSKANCLIPCLFLMGILCSVAPQNALSAETASPQQKTCAHYNELGITFEGSTQGDKLPLFSKVIWEFKPGQSVTELPEIYLNHTAYALGSLTSHTLSKVGIPIISKRYMTEDGYTEPTVYAAIRTEDAPNKQFYFADFTFDVQSRHLTRLWLTYGDNITDVWAWRTWKWSERGVLPQNRASMPPSMLKQYQANDEISIGIGISGKHEVSLPLTQDNLLRAFGKPDEMKLPQNVSTSRRKHGLLRRH